MAASQGLGGGKEILGDPAVLRQVSVSIQKASAGLMQAITDFERAAYLSVADFGTTNADHQVGRRYRDFCEQARDRGRKQHESADLAGEHLNLWAQHSEALEDEAQARIRGVTGRS